jgi:hypothetical protein
MVTGVAGEPGGQPGQRLANATGLRLANLAHEARVMKCRALGHAVASPPQFRNAIGLRNTTCTIMRDCAAEAGQQQSR